MIERAAPPVPSKPSAALIERLPPHDLEAEMAVLASILLDAEVMGAVAALLKPEDFYRGAHQRLYEVMRSLYDRGEPIDALLVFRQCERQAILEEIGGRDYLATLASAVSTPSNGEHYARIVREKSIARSLIQVSSEIQQAAYAEEGRGDELLERAEQAIFELGNKRDPGHARRVADLLHEAFDEMQDRDGTPQSVLTGFYMFDDLTTGLRPGELIIVAGRPSMGKTTFALNAAMNAAVNDGKKVAVFSLEMTAQNIVRNMLCAMARFPGRNLRRGGRFLGADDHRRLADAAGPLFEASILVDDTPALTPTTLRAKSRRMKAKQGLDLIVVDYLQLMEAIGDVRSVESRQQEIAYISRSLKGLARELEVPVIAISQLNRDAEKREGHRPKLSDLRECVCGDTRVSLADGRLVPIRDLVGTTPDVVSVDANGLPTVARSDLVWPVGVRPVHDVLLSSGRRVRATAEHRLLGKTGWLPVQAIRSGVPLAVTRAAEVPASAVSRWHAPRTAPETRSAAHAATLEHEPRVDLATVELGWERVVAVEPAGYEEVYDLTVPGPSCWVANGIVSHNSGAIEQDADVICLLYRPYYYTRNESDKRKAEVIIAKQRNGPTDIVHLNFFDEFLRFDNPAPERI
jgi:replicative DNA helicase